MQIPGRLFSCLRRDIRQKNITNNKKHLFTTVTEEENVITTTCEKYIIQYCAISQITVGD